MIEAFTPLTYSPKRTQGVYCLFDDPPSISLPAPRIAISATPGAIIRFQSHTPLDRVVIWVREIVRKGSGPLPTMQLDLYAGPLGNAGTQVASVAKGLSTFALDSMFFEVGGVRGEVWTLVASLINPNPTPVDVGLTITGDCSHSCELVVTT